jgi:hypothetical protein
MPALSEPNPTNTPRPALPRSIRRRDRTGHRRGGVETVIFPSIGPIANDKATLLIDATYLRRTTLAI